MKRQIKGATIRGYMRRGLLGINFSETAEDTERRISYDKLTVLFIVPWRIVDNEELWQPSKEDFMEAAAILNHIRTEQAARIRKERAAARA